MPQWIRTGTKIVECKAPKHPIRYAVMQAWMVRGITVMEMPAGMMRLLIPQYALKE